MKFRLEHRFEGGPFEKAVHFLTEEYIFEATRLPNVKSGKPLEEKITDDTKYWKNEWCAHGQIPKLVQHLIKPKMLTWIEETTYDRRNKTYFTKVTPFYFRSVFRCENRGYFVKKSDKEFLRIMEGILDIHIHVFGHFIEEQIITHFKRNYEHEYRETFKVIKQKFG
ncbi:MAG: hypothetical protein AB1546_07580 [bacterium]